MNRSTAVTGSILLFALAAALWLVWPQDEVAPEVQTPRVVANTTASSAQEVVEALPSATPEQEEEAQALAERLAESERFMASFVAREKKRHQLHGTRAEPSRYESPSDLVALRNEARAQGTADVRYETLDHEAKDRIKESLRAKVLTASAVDTHSLVHDAEMIRATKEDFGDSLPQLMVLGAAWLDDHERRMRVNLHAGCPLDARQSIVTIVRVTEFLGLTHSEDFDELVKAAKSRTSIKGESDAQAEDRYRKARDENGCLLG